MVDCVIVGGRVAGSSTAIHLARRGYRVTMIDRDRHPSPTLSTHVFGDWEAFAPLGVTERLLDAGAPRVTRFRTDVEGCVTEADMVVTPFVLGLRRERLDAILIERARSFPTVDWHEGCTVTRLLREGERVAGVVVRDERGEPFSVRARVVVGADGRSSRVARAVGAEEYLTRPRVRCAYYAYYEGVTPAPVPTFEYYWWGRDVVLAIPCDDGLHCICVMPPQDEFPDWRRAHAGRIDERLHGIGTLAPRLAGARRVGPIKGSGTLRSYLREPAGPGWALVGDAGAAVHPCIGAGIDHAVVSAGLLAASLDRWFAGDLSWEEATAGYRAERDRRVEPTLEAAVRLARRTTLDGDEIGWLRLLMTLPGLSHDLGAHVEDVLRQLVGEEGVGRLRVLLDEAAESGGRAEPVEEPPLALAEVG